MKHMFFSVILAVYVGQVVHGQTTPATGGPECMRCEGSASVDDCKLTTTICGANEFCYLEKVTTSQLKAVFNAGCRSKQVCDVMALLAGNGKRSVETAYYRGKKADGDLVNCAECCNGPRSNLGPCNSQLCNQKPSASAPACRVCDGPRIDVDSCTKKEPCQPTQVCHTGIRVVGTAVRYIFGCEERHVCAELIKNEVPNHPGRATGLQICDACCDGDECNAADCFLLKKKMTLASIGVGSNTSSAVTQAATPKPTTSIVVTNAPATVPSTPVVTNAATPAPATPAPTTSNPVTLGPAASIVASAATSNAPVTP